VDVGRSRHLPWGHGVEVLLVPQGTDAHEQGVLPPGQQFGDEVGGLAHLIAGQALHPTGDLAVEPVEQLAPAGVDSRDDEAVAVAGRESQQVEARHPHHGKAQGLGQRLSRGHPHTETAEQAGADVDGDGAQLGQLHARLLADELDGGHQGLDVAAPAGGVEGGQHPFVPADGTTDLHGGRLDTQDQHGRAVNLPVPTATAPPRWPATGAAMSGPRPPRRAHARRRPRPGRSAPAGSRGVGPGSPRRPTRRG